MNEYTYVRLISYIACKKKFINIIEIYVILRKTFFKSVSGSDVIRCCNTLLGIS